MTSRSRARGEPDRAEGLADYRCHSMAECVQNARDDRYEIKDGPNPAFILKGEWRQ